MKNLLYFLPFLLLSCSDEAPEPYVNTLAGYYRITSITTETPIDLNLDGIESTDYYAEITSPHFFNGKDKEGSLMADLNDFQYLAEIRPSKENVEFGNLTQYVSFNFPIQVIRRLNPNDESSEITYYEYIPGFKWHTYTFTDTNEVLLEHSLQGDIDNKGNIYKMIRLDDDTFEIYINLEVLKYNEDEWITTKVKVVYVKNEN